MSAMKHYAKGFIDVTSFEQNPYDEAGDLSISEVRVTEQFSGEFVGTGTARFLMVSHPDRSHHFADAHFTGIERFIGRLGPFSGSFILQNAGTLKDGVLNSDWLVIPGSGTGELIGLRGVGGCRPPDGAFLEYWFE